MLNLISNTIAPRWKALTPAPFDLAGRHKQRLAKIASLEPALRKLSDQALRKRSLALRYRAKTGESSWQLLPEAYALVREAAWRTLGMRHYDVQMLGGITLHNRAVAEMQTGEGKTLTATLPMYLAALAGQGAQLATVNDYLAHRDAQGMRPVYEMLGLSVGIIQSNMSQGERRQAYHSDVCYGTAKEFGFDFLRDRLLARRIAEGHNGLLAAMAGDDGAGKHEKLVQRGTHFVLVDEADSILIDEARTPLIIAAQPGQPTKESVAAYHWSAGAAGQFVEPGHYTYDARSRKVELTANGRRLVRSIAQPQAMDTVGMLEIYEHVERAIKVDRDYERDRDYVVRDGEIAIVDEYTGRIAEGRKWQKGIHQAIEARENVEITVDTGQAARITVQDFFRRYKYLAGMTGTAASSSKEFKKIYKLKVARIPTNRPPIRRQLSTAIHSSADQKWTAIVDEVCDIHRQGRPVLIGTRSIEKSERISRQLEAAGIQHAVLNARHVQTEAEIVARAGEQGKVTVATNIAGRGTDIKLGNGVTELGGLHVICTEMHESARVDRQLIGRCGRQGDPGTYRWHLALDDDILGEGFGPRKSQRLSGTRINRIRSKQRQTLFKKAQHRVERRHFRDRKALMFYEKLQKKILAQMGLDPYLDTPA